MADDEGTTTAAPETPATGEPTAPVQPKDASEIKVPPEVERALKKANKEAETLRLKLKDIEDRDKTEAQKLAERASTAESEVEKARTKLLRYEVAAKKNLPPTLAARLQGSTKEELEADAEVLLKEFGTQAQRQTPSYDGGVRKPAPATNDMNALIRRAAGH
ncbi:MAG TPA: hypothetical protein VK597_02270 [Inquilinus sp.]|nr:hypothetical protein [Inquilinus sp.]